MSKLVQPPPPPPTPPLRNVNRLKCGASSVNIVAMWLGRLGLQAPPPLPPQLCTLGMYQL